MSIQTEIRQALNHLAKLCGFGNSEWETEDFAMFLVDCLDQVLDEIGESHEQGLGYDAVGALAYWLEASAPEVKHRTPLRVLPPPT